MIIDYLVELGLNVIKEFLTERNNIHKAKEKLRTYIEKKQRENEICSLKEELDFEHICQYLYSDLIDDVKYYICLHGEDRKRKRRDITNKAVVYASTSTKLSALRAEQMASSAIDILYTFFRDEASQDLLLLFGEVEEYIVDGVEKLKYLQKEETGQLKKHITEEIANSELRIKDYIKNDCAEQMQFQNFIARQKELVKNYTIFPWFNDSLKYREVFPKLFIEPFFMVRDGKFGFNDLISIADTNIAILGDAGAGKSTLMRFIFAFHEIKDCQCLYITAKEAETGILERIINNTQQHFLIFIDGIDEAFHSDYRGFEKLITKLKTSSGCHFWLGCRTDYYQKCYGENINFVENTIRLLPWTEQQSNNFINIYSDICCQPDLVDRVNHLTDKKDIKENPFRLALLVFLAEHKETERISGVYDLYEKFMQKWLDREQKRGTCANDNRTIIRSLRLAAAQIYDGCEFAIDEMAENNSAIKDLLLIDSSDMYNKRYARAFYHRSLAAFLLAQNIMEAMLSNNTLQFEQALVFKLKDDVTNFIGDKFSTLSNNTKLLIKDNLQGMYELMPNDDSKLRIKEQIIYFITRLGVDVSDFLIQVIRTKPQNRIMKLTLAYGCVLSNLPEARQFALDYAKSIAAESIDAVTNRAWTVVYFGDVVANPYEYIDDEKSQWKNARAARIKRFTKKNPRLKDYRFRLFDIPLFFSFLKDRNWNDLSVDEFNIIKNVDFPHNIFNENEITFLEEKKDELLRAYESHLNTILTL